MKIHPTVFHVSHLATCLAALALAATPGCSGNGSSHRAAFSTQPSRSTNIALTTDDHRVVVVNRESDSISVLQVRDAAGADAEAKIAEVAVGREPRYLALSPDDRRAYVANTESGTVSVVALAGIDAFTVEAEISVGHEPRGLALTPTGARLYVANHTERTVSVIDTSSLTVVDTVHLVGNPVAIAITNDGDRDDADETVFVTQFYAELVPGGPGEGFDEGKQGVVWSFPVGGGAVEKSVLAPLADAGFTADRAPFCAHFNAQVHSEIFCPNPAETLATAPAIAADPQGAFPNQLASLVIRNGLLYVPSIGASPEPPVRFNVNVQALVHVLATDSKLERADLRTNLNAQVKAEAIPASPLGSLQRLFGNDLVAIDGNEEGSTFLIVSRGGNFVFQAHVDAGGKLTLGAPDVIRYQTGNLPTGVAISGDGRRAYVANEVNLSVTAIDLVNQVVLARDIAAGTPPVPGSFDHGRLAGRLAFHTALGMPDGGIFATPLRDIVPLDHRGQASGDAWSSCASCHTDGLADGVTWIFGTGPRQTLSLDAFFSKENSADQRISNWSGVMGSITDFNNNARGVQGGIGFAGNPPPAAIFQHGITEGASEALDAMTLWVQTVRAPILPEASDVFARDNGEILFVDNCASCHAGPKWTKSQVVYDNNPTFDKDPNAGGVPIDPGVTNAGPQIVSLNRGPRTLPFLEKVGTFDPANPLEIRGQTPTFGQAALGGLGFNVPSLLGVSYQAPYLHDGSAQTLAAVFARHGLQGGTIATTFTDAELSDLLVFLSTIDGSTPTVPSATDLFLEAVGN